MTAVQVNSLLIEAIRTSEVPGSNGVWSSTSARPYPLLAVAGPVTTETTTPGTWSAARRSGTSASKKAIISAALGVFSSEEAVAGEETSAAHPATRAMPMQRVRKVDGHMA